MQKQNLFIPFIFLFILLGACSNESNKEIKAPNVIFILADDLGYGDVSCYNENSKIQTPNIDKLANNGVRFTNAHTSSAVCTPTRYGILTGRYNWRSTLKEGVLNGYSKALIDADRTTVAGFLKENGYNTAYIGKWHLGWDWSIIGEESPADGNKKWIPKVDFSQPVKNGPNTRGFDYSYGFCGSLDMPPYVWVENGMPTMVPTEKTVNKDKQGFWREGLTSDDFNHEEVLFHITDKAVEYINEEANNDKPFFLYLPLSAPHTPILPTQEFKGKSGLDNPYGDFVLMVDKVVEEISKALKDNEIEENTLLVFTSDNGCSPRANYEQLATKGHDPSYVFRGHKADIFEGGHRVPYIVNWPAKVKNATSNQMLCTTDLMATLADILHVDLQDNMAEDSYSYLSALQLQSEVVTREAIVHHSVNGSFAISKGDWKAIFCPGSGGWSDPRPNSKVAAELPKVQLYNLKNDVEETTNVQDQHPEIVEELRQLLLKYINDGRSTAGLPQKNDGPATWKQMEWIRK